MTCRKEKCTKYYAGFIHQKYVTVAEEREVWQKASIEPFVIEGPWEPCSVFGLYSVGNGEPWHRLWGETTNNCLFCEKITLTTVKCTD